MGSEEWGPPDARKMEACDSCDCASSYARYMLQYFDVPLGCTDFTAWKANYDKYYSPYMYNFAWESGIDGIPTKHMAMGRRGTKLPYVMPDEKTVYLTDDSYSAVLTVFVADRPRDLSAGRLWCWIGMFTNQKWQREVGVAVGNSSICGNVGLYVRILTPGGCHFQHRYEQTLHGHDEHQ